MSWLSEILFPGRTAREAELVARVEHYAGRCEELSAITRAALGNQRRTAEMLQLKDQILEMRHQRLEAQDAIIRSLRIRLAEAQGGTGPKPQAGTRLGRALDACAGYRKQLAADARLIREQQRKLDGFLGLDDPHVLAGVNWQATREDKRREVKP